MVRPHAADPRTAILIKFWRYLFIYLLNVVMDRFGKKLCSLSHAKVESDVKYFTLVIVLTKNGEYGA